MKKQLLDTIIHNDTKCELLDSPLYSYLVKLGYNPFYSPRTNYTRGYVAAWEIREGKLFLINFKEFKRRKNKVEIEYLFPNKTEVLAEWFNETIRIDLGVNFGYLVSGKAVYKQVLYLKFEKGIQKWITISEKNYIDLKDESVQPEAPDDSKETDLPF